MKLLSIFVLLLPTIVSAQSSSWLKKTNPNEMYRVVAVTSGCPLAKDEAENIVDGALVRSRIKPLSSWTDNEVGLDVNVDCIAGDQPLVTYVIRVELSKTYYDGDTLVIATMPGKTYGGFGRDDKSGINSLIRESVEDAIYDYLIANFDLEEDK